MKLSDQHASGGLSGHIRSVQTGEVVHFQFSKSTTKLPFEIVLGDKRLEVYLRADKVETDHGDDVDMELTLRAPDVATPASLDYVPKIAPPPPGGKIEQDGSAMAATSDTDEVIIKDGPVQDKRELVLGESEREEYAIKPTTLSIQRAEDNEKTLFDGEEQVGLTEAGEEDPVTKVPSLPGVGSERRKKRN